MIHAQPSPRQHPNPASGLVFEHPLTERVRSFLRLEAVLAEARERIPHPEPEISRAALATLIELGSLTERSELKREVLTELERQRLVLGQLREASGVDAKRLREALGNLERTHAAVAAMSERPGQNLKGNEFLASVRSRSTIPGGTCAFDLPALHCWLARPLAERRADLDHWLVELAPLDDAVRLLLRHTREAGEPIQLTANDGVYGYTPPSENPPALLRITLPAASGLFPLVSAGRHRVTIQFQRWLGADIRPETLRRDVDFTLALCRL
jgi:cell division protein ZapD